jgi:hypothetical protein
LQLTLYQIAFSFGGPMTSQPDNHPLAIALNRPGYIGLAVTEHAGTWRAAVELPGKGGPRWVDGPVMPTTSAAITAAFFVAFPIKPPGF